MKDLDGTVCYRTEIAVSASMTRMPAKVALGIIVNADFLYVNGVLFGNVIYYYLQRRYLLPARLGPS